MIIQKQIITTKELNISFLGITLLSLKEYESYKDIIPLTHIYYWTRTTSKAYFDATIVDHDGRTYNNVSVSDYAGVRPVLLFDSCNELHQCDKVEVAGHIWTVICDNMMLCDEIIGRSSFEESSGKNDYKDSTVKKWLDKWYEENIKEE